MEEQRHVTIVRSQFVPRHRPIDDHVGSPGVLVREIGPGLRIPILGSLRAHHNRSKQPVARIRHHVAPIPHQRRGFTVERIRVVGIGPLGARSDRLIAWVVTDVGAHRILRIEGQTNRGEGGLALLHLVLQIDFDAISNVHTKRERHGVRTTRHLRGIFLQGVNLGLGVADLDLPLEVHLDGLRRLRVELHRRIIQGHDVEALHRRVSRTNRQRLGNVALDGESGRQLLQIFLLFVKDTNNAPSPFGELRRPTVEVDVVTRLQPWSTSLRHHEVVALRNPDVHRILPIRIGGIPFTQEGMTRDGPGHRLVHEGVEETEHHRVSHIGP